MVVWTICFLWYEILKMENYWTFDFGVRRFEQIRININIETLNSSIPKHIVWLLNSEDWIFYLNAQVLIANIWITNHSIYSHHVGLFQSNHWNCSSNRMHLTILKYFITHLLFQLEIFDIEHKKRTTTQTQKYIITKNGIITFFGLSFIL